MNLSYKNRVAVQYILGTSAVMLIVFFIIFFTVKQVLYLQIDHEIDHEIEKHLTEIGFEDQYLFFINKNEWEEREHREAQIKPVFVQLIDRNGLLLEKSPNLKKDLLIYSISNPSDFAYNTTLRESPIRQVQTKIEYNGIDYGYMLTAIPLEGALLLLNNLKKTLMVLYPLVLFSLFFISRYLAGKSIKPVQQITATTNSIYKNNLSERVGLPTHNDELHALSSSINNLLERIELALKREKQFTADASHQLRTPLAVIKGTLEVLIRKPRSAQEYHNKIQETISEINRMSIIVDQLLLLARFENKELEISADEADLQLVIDDLLYRYRHEISEKNISVDIKTETNSKIKTDLHYIDIIFDNIISNAVKYSKENGILTILIHHKNGLSCEIKDNGIGIPKTYLEQIFVPFSRSENTQEHKIPGSGLGLSIVKKAAKALNAKIKVSSIVDQGTTVTIIFPKPK